MAFIQAAASVGMRTDTVLSADNDAPQRHVIIETLRTAAPLIGLGAPVLATLDAMLSCLPPKRNHHTVFASNATLTFRRNGISDRTLRRHAARLQEAGLLIRHDSPNGKRFSRHNAQDGKTLRFGFDLSPLFARLQEIAALAAEALQRQDEIAYLRCKIRAAASSMLDIDPEHPQALEARRALRRNLTVVECQSLLSALDDSNVQAEDDGDMTLGDTLRMTANDGQNVRHHHKSKKENIEKEAETEPQALQPSEAAPNLSIPELVTACPEAAQFSLRPITTASDVIAHARTLAPMMGIDNGTYQAAETKLGALGSALTIWALMQLHDRVRSMGAYFRTITTGTKSTDFNPVTLIKRLAISQRRLTP